MKKIIIIFVVMLLLTVITLTLCSCQKEDPQVTGRFVKVGSQSLDANHSVTIFYDSETKVMYVFYKSGYSGGLSPLYNADGTLMIYEESDNGTDK